MPSTFTYEWDTPAYKGKTSYATGLFINGQFLDGSEGSTIDVINPTNGKLITKVSEASAKDVDTAVEAAQKAFETTWGFNAPGTLRAELLFKLAQLIEQNRDELAALEALDNGKTFTSAQKSDVTFAIMVFKYYAGWADKIGGKTLETTDKQLVYTRHEPIGVVGQIIPWNASLTMLSFKLGPALATGNTVVFKPSEITPLTAIRMCHLINEAGFPPGVVNIITGYGHTVGAALASHMSIDKISFTGSTMVGRMIMEAAAKSNLKNVTMELGGKSPNIIFNDANLDQAVNWASFGLFYNHGQACCAGTRIYVQSGIYEAFLEKFTERAKQIKLGDPFELETSQGPQVSKAQCERVMGYIESGRSEGATVHLGGERFGDEGYFIKPTIFTDTRPDMKIVREEIFGPVGVVIKFEDEADVIRQANDTFYGLAAAVFSQNITRAIETAHQLKAGSVWVNCYNSFHPGVPFSGFKQSGIGQELGEYALKHYTNVKAVHINLGQDL